MTPDELRAAIPATEAVAYFNTGASGPPPRHVVDAVADFQAYHAYESPAEEGMYDAGSDAMDGAREAVAGLLGTTPRDVTFAESTTAGINLIAGSVDWQPGDVVVRTDLEHPSGILPWQRLADTHDVQVRVAPSSDGRLDMDAYRDAVRDARLVCVSAVSWNYGTRLPVRELVEIAHEAGALVLVDAVQAPGQLPVDVEAWGADVVVGAGHKWLLGPWGAGFLYVSPEARDQLRPTRIGPAGVKDPEAAHYEYTDEAAMFELTTTAVSTYAGLEAAIETIESVGIGAIRDRIETLTDHLKTGIPDDRLHSPREYETGLVSFDVDDPERFVEQCSDDDVVVRDVPYPECVRASVHAFNTTEEIDRLLEHV